MKSVALGLLLAMIESFDYKPLIYACFPVLVVHSLIYYIFYDFIGISEKITFGLMSAANVFNLIMIVLEMDIAIVYYTIIGVVLMEFMMVMFKLYRLLVKRKRLSRQVHPIISLKTIVTHSKDTLEPPIQPGKEADISIASPHR
jgi:hypothetical protein